jgi:hypothetical protein
MDERQVQLIAEAGRLARWVELALAGGQPGDLELAVDACEALARGLRRELCRQREGQDG